MSLTFTDLIRLRSYQSKRTFSSHLIPPDLLLSCTSCLSLWVLSFFGITAKRKVYYAVDTIAHNGPLFWLDVVERSLVKHISSSIKSHPAISIPFYLLNLSPCSPSALPLALFPTILVPFIIIYPWCREYFHLSSRLVVEKKAGISVRKYFWD